MWHFFDQAQNSVAGDSPIGPEMEFQGQNATGLIEKRTDEGGHFILLLASGAPVGAYRLEVAGAKPIPISEFISSALPEQKKVHAVKLPDAAGRMIWLALESKPQGKISLAGNDAWQDKLAEWKANRWSGLVEIKAGAYHGFVFFWQGETLATEAVLHTPLGFATGLPAFAQMETTDREITLYELGNASPACQCFILRQGAVHWSHDVLIRYQELVGKNLLQVMNREINRSIRPWNWKLALEEDALVDAHFFPHLQSAAHAYRALFMGMGAQMSFMIGNNLAQRIFSEAFKITFPDETAALQAQRLIPAAFTD